MKYQIKSSGSTQGLCNPLRKINGEYFYDKMEAVECVYHALYDIIDGENGCEFVKRNFDGDSFGDNDEACIRAIEKYHQEAKDYIWDHMSATEDGWTATIEEIED